MKFYYRVPFPVKVSAQGRSNTVAFVDCYRLFTLHNKIIEFSKYKKYLKSILSKSRSKNVNVQKKLVVHLLYKHQWYRIPWLLFCKHLSKPFTQKAFLNRYLFLKRYSVLPAAIERPKHTVYTFDTIQYSTDSLSSYCSDENSTYVDFEDSNSSHIVKNDFSITTHEENPTLMKKNINFSTTNINKALFYDVGIDPSSNIGFEVECSICFSQPTHVLWNRTLKQVATLQECPHNGEYHLHENVLFNNPCKKHAICVQCFRKVCLDSAHPPFTLQQSRLPCVSIDNGTPCKSFYSMDNFKYIFTDAEYTYLSNLYEQFKYAGYVAIKCPLQSAKGSLCNAECLIESKILQQETYTSAVVDCVKNMHCFGRFCYYCHCSVDYASIECIRCKKSKERVHPEAVNHYAVKGDWMEQKMDCHLLKNKEITVESVVEQLNRIVSMNPLHAPCNRCGVPLHKTSACNALSHCGVEKCYVCGYCTKVGEKIPTDHWDESGLNGCPRFDSDPCWKTLSPPFVCEEGFCYSHCKDCLHEEHRSGLQEYDRARKRFHINGLLSSLPRSLEITIESL